MSGQMETTNENQDGQVEIDSWAAAFAALDKKDQEDSQAAADPAVGGGDGGEQGVRPDTDTQGTDGNPGPDNAEDADGAGDAQDAGGLGAATGEDGVENGEPDGDLLGVTDEDIESYRAGLVEEVRDKAIGDVAAEFVKRGIRHTNGRLGATIEDEDICKRDDDGVPHFFNPDTGREFTGDNPRRQAQEWVEDYNKELATAFNQACEKYEAKLLEGEQPGLKVLEFAPKYDKLDPIRKGMLDNVIEDYEITDNSGSVVGYSCDLDKALAMVDRQVAMIQNYAKQNTAAKLTSTGPALDMKNSAGAATKSGEKPDFKSLAEAMEWEQDQLLEKMRKKGN